MGDKTGIQWTDSTWNPVTGCSRVSDGCRFCYAETVSHRFGWTKKPWSAQNAAENVVIHADRLEQPLRWRRPRRIFVNSMSDLFHESVPFEFIDRVFAVMGGARQHVFQVLTKRPARMLEYMDDDGREAAIERAAGQMCAENGWCHLDGDAWPLPNVWLGVSVEDQRAADERIPVLLQTPAAVHFLSCEPLLGPIDFTPPRYRGSNVNRNYWLQGIDWVIVGGESGPNARPMHPSWARWIRDACVGRTDMARPWSLPFFFKQWGEWQDGSTLGHRPHLDRVILKDGQIFEPHLVRDQVRGELYGKWGSMLPTMISRVGKHAAGRDLDGRTWDEFPRVAAALTT